MIIVQTFPPEEEGHTKLMGDEECNRCPSQTGLKFSPYSVFYPHTERVKDLLVLGVFHHQLELDTIALYILRGCRWLCSKTNC